MRLTLLTVAARARNFAVMTTTPHFNPATLGVFLPNSERGLRSAAATAAEITPGHLHDFLTGRRYGSDPRIREAVAKGISEATGISVTAEAITCSCSSPASHRKVAA